MYRGSLFINFEKAIDADTLSVTVTDEQLLATIHSSRQVRVYVNRLLMLIYCTEQTENLLFLYFIRCQCNERVKSSLKTNVELHKSLFIYVAVVGEEVHFQNLSPRCSGICWTWTLASLFTAKNSGSCFAFSVSHSHVYLSNVCWRSKYNWMSNYLHIVDCQYICIVQNWFLCIKLTWLFQSNEMYNLFVLINQWLLRERGREGDDRMVSSSSSSRSSGRESIQIDTWIHRITYECMQVNSDDD